MGFRRKIIKPDYCYLEYVAESQMEHKMDEGIELSFRWAGKEVGRTSNTKSGAHVSGVKGAS